MLKIWILPNFGRIWNPTKRRRPGAKSTRRKNWWSQISKQLRSTRNMILNNLRLSLMFPNQKEQALILTDQYSSIWSSTKVGRKGDSACLIGLAQEVQRIKSAKKMKAILKVAIVMLQAELIEGTWIASKQNWTKTKSRWRDLQKRASRAFLMMREESISKRRGFRTITSTGTSQKMINNQHIKDWRWIQMIQTQMTSKRIARWQTTIISKDINLCRQGRPSRAQSFHKSRRFKAKVSQPSNMTTLPQMIAEPWQRIPITLIMAKERSTDQFEQSIIHTMASTEWSPFIRHNKTKNWVMEKL